MNKFISWYNSNRRRFWTIVIIVILIFAVIRITDEFLKQRQNDRNQNTNRVDINSSLNSISMQDNKSVITGQKMTEEQVDSLKILDDFASLCSANKFNEAYNLLSEDCKSEMYPTVNNFKNNYYNKVFAGKEKIVSADNWIGNIYKVQFADNPLASGTYTSENVVEDYITIVTDNEGNRKLNINSFIRKQSLNKEQETSNITVKVLEKYAYMDYEIYTFEITNNTNSSILLNNNSASGEAMYVEDANGIRYSAYTHELSEAYLKLASKETRKIKIKYYNKYGSNKEIKSVVFGRVILDYEVYENYENQAYYTNYINIQITL